MKDKSRLARLTAIITLLQSKQLVTAKEIADRHQVSIRTVYRDIRTLEESGIPLFTEEGKGYSLVEGFRLPPILFTEEEANAILIAEQLIQRNKDLSLVNAYEAAVTKIKATLNHTQKANATLLASRLQVRNNHKKEQSSNYLIQLQATISNYQQVSIDYQSLDNQQSSRTLEPFALYTTQDNWVLIAFCLLRQDFRAFRLDCIQRLKVLEKHFEPHKMTLQQYLESCSKKY